VAFARAVDAVFSGGFAERHEDEFAENEFSQFSQSVEGFADVQSSDGTESGRDRDNGGETVGRPFAEPQNRCETGEAAGFSQFSQSGEGFAELAEPVKSDTPRDRARARVEDGDKEPRRAPMPWLSQRSRGERSILDMEF
jgi:hypothetical protein